MHAPLKQIYIGGSTAVLEQFPPIQVTPDEFFSLCSSQTIRAHEKPVTPRPSAELDTE